MCDQSEISYADGDVVWVKLGSCWWPGEVCGLDNLPPGILKSFRKPPIAVVKFFQEESFEYVKNINFIYKYNCSRKNDFIKKGLDLFRSKHSHMDKFPEDVCTAERLTDGDPDIITSDEFLPKKKESYANIFGTPVDTSAKRNSLGKRGRPGKGSNKNNITPRNLPRIIPKYFKGSSDYKAHILVQPTSSPSTPESSPVERCTSATEPVEDTPKATPKATPKTTPESAHSAGIYSCPACNFTATRLNVIILHNKSHSSGAIPYAPIKTPKPKIPAIKPKPKSVTLADDDEFEVASTSKKRKATPKTEGRPRGRPRNILENVTPDMTTPDKTIPLPPKRKMNKQKERESKKAKTDVEIKNSLLADWNEDSEEEPMDVLTSLKLSQNVSETVEESKTENPDAEPEKIKTPIKLNNNEKPEKQTSCFDFEEDEDLQIENIGKKIPRLSTTKSEEFTKRGIDVNISDIPDADKPENNARVKTDIDFDSEIDNLLSETTVPELPPLPSQSNFQITQPVKVPDKEKTSENKSIFKTKTFFRSRHSRSQDAIEKYVADNTSTDKPPTYMNEPVESERSSDIASESLSDNSSLSQDNDVLPVPAKTETAKITKYAPKIQLKKLNAALVNKNKDSNTIIPAEDSGLSNFIEVRKDSNKSAEIEDNISKDDSVFSNGNDSQVLTSLMKSPENVLNDEILSNENESQNVSEVEDKQKSSDTEPNIESSRNITPLPDVSEAKEVSENETTDTQTKSIPSIEPTQPKIKSPLKILSTKIIKPQILNFDVGNSQSKQLPTIPQNQKIIIRRTKSKSDTFRESSQDDVQTFTIEEPTCTNDDLLDPKLKMVNKGFSVSAKPHNTIITSTGEIIQADKLKSEDSVFDINSMPIVLSEEIVSKNSSPMETITTKNVTPEPSKVISLPDPVATRSVETPVKKSIIVKSVIEKTVSPNILSKSKGKTLKHLLIVDKKTGEKKIIKAGNLTDELKEHMLQSERNKTLGSHQSEKIIINSKFPGGKKTQKVIIAQSPKNQVVVGRLGETGEPEMFISSNPSTLPKNVSKTIPNNPTIDHSTGNAIMILTNSQGVQSKILLTPEQQLLFPKGKMHNVSVTTQSNAPRNLSPQSIVVSSAQILSSESSNASSPSKLQISQSLRTIPKQKNTILNKNQIVMSTNKRTILTTMPGQAILTSKGQLIAPQSSIITSSSKIVNINKPASIISPSKSQKIIGKTISLQSKQEKLHLINNTFKSQNSKVVKQTILQGQLKDSSIFLPQKPGTVMHLTAAQFEELQKSGQLISKSDAKGSKTYVLQKKINAKPTIMSEIDNKKMNRMDNVFSSDIPPLTPIIPEHNLKKQKFKEQYDNNKKYVPEETINTDCGLSDADDLIPATIIPTRKHEMLQKKQLETQHILNQEIANATPEPTKQLESNLDENQIATNTLNDPQKQLLAIPGENFGGPPNSFFLCVEENGTLTPVDNQPLILENNQLVPMVVETAETPKEQPQQQILEIPNDQAQQNILLNIGDQQILIDHQTLLTLLAGDGQQLVTNDGQQLVFQGNTQQILNALASNPELAGLLGGGHIASQIPDSSEGFAFPTNIQPNVNQDILAAALAGTEVFQQDSLTTDTERIMMDIDSLNSNIQNINAHSNVYETSSTLNQPIMSPLEIPTKKRCDDTAGLLAISKNSTISKNLDDSLAVIGVTTPNVPTSLDLPITVTNPRIAAKTTTQMSLTNSGVYQSSSLLNNSLVSSGMYEAEKSNNALGIIGLKSPENPTIASSMPCLDESSSESFADKVVEPKTYSPISMPILTDDAIDDDVDKNIQEEIKSEPISMPIISELESDKIIEETTMDPIEDNSVSVNEDNSVNTNEDNSINMIDDNSVNANEDTSINAIEENSISPIEDNSINAIEDNSMNAIEENSMNAIEGNSMNAIEENSMNAIEENSMNAIEGNSMNAIEENSMNAIEENSMNAIEGNSMNAIEENSMNAIEENSMNAIEENSMTAIEENSINAIEDNSVNAIEDNSINPIEDNSLNANEDNSVNANEDTSVDSTVEKISLIEESDNCTESIVEQITKEITDEVELKVDTPTDFTEEAVSPLVNNTNSNPEPDEICADTPPTLLDHDSTALYEPELCDDTNAHNEADGNSLPDHMRDELNISCSSESAALPDSTSDVAPPSPEPQIFSDSSSDASTEIPIQPMISVSHSVVQNFSSMLNPDSDEKIDAFKSSPIINER